jgi:tetratricopeptide (TPR) repeat protein
MKRFLDSPTWGRLAAIFALIVLLGVAPRPHLVAATLAQAQRAISFGAHNEAAQKIALAAEQMPWRRDLWELAGREALSGNDPAQALVDFEKASGNGGLSSEGYLLQGEAYWQSGQLAQAVQSWRVATQLGAPALETWNRILQAQLACHDYGGAVDSLSILVNLKPKDGGLRYQLGALLAARQPDLAVAHLRQAAELDSTLATQAESLAGSIQSVLGVTDPAYRLVIAGRALASLGEWSLAAEAFRQATIQRPDYAEAWAFWGEALQHPEGQNASSLTGQPGQSQSQECNCCEQNASTGNDPLAVLHKALDIDPESLAANTFLALYWQRQNDYPLALAYLEKAVVLDPNNPALSAQMGEVKAISGDLPAALQAYRRASELAVGQIAYLKLLINFTLQYRYQVEETGLPTARRALQLNPDDPECFDLMGQVLFQLEDINSAEVFFRRAIDLDPNAAWALLHLGQLYLKRGSTAEAREILSRALTAAPPGTPIAETAQALLQSSYP